jgi:hypothetical protein
MLHAASVSTSTMSTRVDRFVDVSTSTMSTRVDRFVDVAGGDCMLDTAIRNFSSLQ